MALLYLARNYQFKLWLIIIQLLKKKVKLMSSKLKIIQITVIIALETNA